MSQTENSGSWSDLPLKLTGLVLRCLPADTDRLCFAAVCRSWRFSSKQHGLSRVLPWLALCDGTFFSLPHNESFRFPDSAGYHSSSGDWLFFLQDGTCSIMNPFSKVTLTLPNLSCVRSINEPVDIVNIPGVERLNMVTLLLNMLSGISVWKVTVCSPVLVAAIFVIGSIRAVALCRPGATSWLFCELDNGTTIMDIIFFEEKLYAVGFSDLFAIHIGEDVSGEPRVSQIERVIEGPLPLTMGFRLFEPSQLLVESHGALLLVRREVNYKESYQSETSRGYVMVVADIKVLVFEADLGSSEWVEVKSVGDDTALLMGKGCSRSVCVSQFKPWGNRIFF